MDDDRKYRQRGYMDSDREVPGSTAVETGRNLPVPVRPSTSPARVSRGCCKT